MKLETIIGLEIHVQLKTKSKMFCSCSNAGENMPPNTAVCPVCLGHPGTLPVPNKQAIEWAVKAALALNCAIPHHSKFDRKHYFYPDLPKGYQISQYDEPIGTKGSVRMTTHGEERTIRIHRLHIEEDAAKLIHDERGGSYVDYNRGGTPLVEIVTEADIASPEEAGEFLRELRLAMRYLGISDADMEKGHLRCDANISMRPAGDSRYYPKTEVKNLNSFKAVERSLAYEIRRQSRIWEETGSAPQEQGTRGWDENEGKTIIQRIKEEAHDYRYFPEPDIPELDFSEAWVREIRSCIPELPVDLRSRFCEQYGFSREDAKRFSQDFELAQYTEEVISELRAWLGSFDADGTEEEIWERNRSKAAKLVSSWVLSKLLALTNEHGVGMSAIKITAENMAELIALIHQNKVSGANAQHILAEMFETGGDPSDIMESKDLGQMDDDNALEEVIDRIVNESAKQVEQYRSGKESIFQYFVGQVMKQTKGKADPVQTAELLKKKLHN